MDFGLTDEQRAVVATTRAFVERELYPHEEEVERTGVLRPELRDEIAQKAIKAGLYAANMPEEVGGAGLDTVTWVLYEKELGRANYALQYTVGRPSNILLGGTEAQKERYLYPCVRGERRRLHGHDRARRGLRPARACAPGPPAGRTGRAAGGSRAPSTSSATRDESDFVIMYARDRRLRRRQGDLHVPGRLRHPGRRGARRLPQRLAPRLHQLDHRLRLLGARATRCSARRARASTWPAPGWAAPASRWRPRCLGRAERALDLAVRHAAEREQFGQKIGRFQGISFKLADMARGAEGGRADDAGGGLEVRRGHRAPTPTSRWPS